MVTCPKPHSWQEAELGFEPGQSRERNPLAYGISPGPGARRALWLLTRRWGRVQMHILAVLAVARLVAAADAQHVHRARVRILKQGAGAPHLLPPLPAGGARLGWHICAPELNGVVPGRWRVGGQPPAQEDLVVGKGALGVDDWSLGHCWKRQRGSVRAWPRAWRGGRAGKGKAAGAGGVSVSERDLGKTPVWAPGQGRAGQSPRQKEGQEAWGRVLGCHSLTLDPLSGPQLPPLPNEGLRSEGVPSFYDPF